MRWVEVIQLRSSGEEEIIKLVDRLRHSFSDELEGELVDVRIYRCATIGTDLSVHLVYQTSGGSSPDAGLGEQLVTALGAHGITDRTLWFEPAAE